MQNCFICCDSCKQTLTYLVEGNEQSVCADCVGKLQAPIARVLRVPSFNMPALNERLEKLARRAKRIGLPAPAFQEIRVERASRRLPESNEDQVYLNHYIAIDPGCSAVKVNGWTFVATIQHTEEGNIIRKVSECHIPVQYRKVSHICEHCNTVRNRKDTYILHNDTTNEYKQVGRNCLSDFFGHDALMYAEQAQYISDMHTLGESMEDNQGYGANGPVYDMLEKYLGHVAQCISVDGWMSRSRARALDVNNATADVAYVHLHPNMASRDYDFLYTTLDPESEKVAQAAIDWAASIEGEDVSDYLHNIRTIASRGVCDSRDLGLAASIVAAYQRHLNNLRLREIQARRAEIAQYVGEVGERRLFKLNVEKVMAFERDGYGHNSGPSVVHLHIMSDANGNVFTWWSSVGALSTGADVVLKATIKKHEERKGVKQNVLSRCEEVELKTYIAVVGGNKYYFEASSEAEAKKALRARLGVKTLPRNIQIVIDDPEKVEGLGESDSFTIAV